MFKVLKLTQNENMKIYRRLRTWIMLAILFLIMGAVSYLMYTGQGDDKSGNVYDLLSFSANFLDFVSIFCVIIAGDIVSSEFGWGTIKLLLIRPVSRTKVLVSKYLAVLLFSLFFVLMLLLFAFLFGMIFFGTGQSETSFNDVLLEYLYKIPNLIIGFTIAFMISAVFRSSALAIGLGIFLMSGASQLVVALFAKYNWAKYILYANTDLSQYRDGHQKPYFEGMSLSFSLTMLAIYYVLFLLITWWVFKRRDVTN